MQIIINRAILPEYNLAAEEYLTDTVAEDTFMLWRNASSVIFGRNQNPWAELDLGFVKSHGIRAVRRMTGGGAVFHDLGNVNYSFIRLDGVKELDFASFISSVIAALAKFGIKAEADGRNDIIADGMKISGSAQLVKTRADGREVQLHHGTLLFDADMTSLAGALRPSPAKLASKGIKSVRSRVGNIRTIDGYHGPDTAEGFLYALEAAAAAEYGVTPREMTVAEKAGADALADAKYRTWEWNYGASPQFDYEKTERTAAGTITVMLSAKAGRITKIKLYGDFFALSDISPLEDALIGAELTPDGVTAKLRESGITARDYILSLADGELAALIGGI